MAAVVIGLSVLGGVVNFINLWEVTPLWMLLEFPVYFLLGGVGLRAGLRIRGVLAAPEIGIKSQPSPNDTNYPSA